MGKHKMIHLVKVHSLKSASDGVERVLVNAVEDWIRSLLVL